MSSKKPSKAERKLAEERRKHEKRREKKRPDGPFAIPEGVRVIRPSPGALKMSEVLEEFMAPDLERVEDLDAIERRFRAGVIAWNLALLPEAERAAAIDEAVSRLAPEASASADERAALRTVFEVLVARKLEFYPEIRRVILDVALREGAGGTKYHLSVLSEPAGLPLAR